MATARRDIDRGQHPIETHLRGYVALCHDSTTPHDVGVGMYARRDPDSVTRSHPHCVTVNVARARQVLREYHDWDLPTESALST